jgi:hypothetical protein
VSIDSRAELAARYRIQFCSKRRFISAGDDDEDNLYVRSGYGDALFICIYIPLWVRATADAEEQKMQSRAIAQIRTNNPYTHVTQCLQMPPPSPSKDL